jgi:hypothetical protein
MGASNVVRIGAVGGESVAAASCVGGRPTGLGFGPPLVTAASEASLAKACAALFVLFPWCLFSCRCDEAWFWKFEEHTTFEGELRLTRRIVFRARLGTARTIPPRARAPGCVRIYDVFFELTFGRSV